MTPCSGANVHSENVSVRPFGNKHTQNQNLDTKAHFPTFVGIHRFRACSGVCELENGVQRNLWRENSFSEIFMILLLKTAGTTSLKGQPEK